MTSRGFYTLLFGSLMLFTALCVDSTGALLLGLTAFAALAVSLVSTVLAALTCRLSQSCSAELVTRGEQVEYALSLRLFAPLPIAPVSLTLRLPSGRESDFSLASRLIGETASESAFTCPHVGVREIGVTHVRVRDCFSLFCFGRKVRAPLLRIRVLPNPVDAPMPAFSPGEGEHSVTQRALADRNTPSDTRAWQEGDELKRVHWKLSMRKQALMVRTYEMPQRPDALILLDCAAPDCRAERLSAMIDTLTQECAGVIRALLSGGHPVRMPLSGKMTRELSAQDDTALTAMYEALATEPFDAPAEFERVLMLCARRMRRTGSTVIFTSRLTPTIADTVIALSRMGPRITFTLVTDEEMTDRQDKLIRLLIKSGIAARHVHAA